MGASHPQNTSWTERNSCAARNNFTACPTLHPNHDHVAQDPSDELTLTDIFPQIQSSFLKPNGQVKWTSRQLNISFNKNRPVGSNSLKTENLLSSADPRSHTAERNIVHHTITQSRLGKKWPATHGATLILTMGDSHHSDNSFEYDYSTDSDDSEGSNNYDSFDYGIDSSFTSKRQAEKNQHVASRHLSLARELLNLELAEAKFARQVQPVHSVQSSTQSNAKPKEELLEPEGARERAFHMAEKQIKKSNGTWKYSNYATAAEYRDKTRCINYPWTSSNSVQIANSRLYQQSAVVRY
jgi:hypothetical protein